MNIDFDLLIQFFFYKRIFLKALLNHLKPLGLCTLHHTVCKFKYVILNYKWSTVLNAVLSPFISVWGRVREDLN